MKTEAQGTITLIKRNGADEVELSIEFEGRALDVAQPARDVVGRVLVRMKPLVADRLKFGDKITVTLSTE